MLLRAFFQGSNNDLVKPEFIIINVTAIVVVIGVIVLVVVNFGDVVKYILANNVIAKL